MSNIKNVGGAPGGGFQIPSGQGGVLPPGHGGVPPGHAKGMSTPTTQTGPAVQTSQPNVGQPVVSQPGTTLPPGQGGIPPGQGGTPPGQAGTPAGTIGMPVAQVQEQSSFSNGNGAANPQASTSQSFVPQQGAGFAPEQSTSQGGNALTWTVSTPTTSNGSQPAPASFDAPESPASNPSLSSSSGEGTLLPTTRAGLPPGHGGVPPGQGGVPPGQAQANPQAGPTAQTSQASTGQPLVPQQSAGVPPGQGGVPPGQGGVPPGQAQANTQAPATQTSPANLGTPLTEIPLANNPVQDGYNVRARTNTDPLLRGMPIETPVKTLVPPLNETKTLDDVKNRFAADYPVLKPQVTDLPHIKDPEKATRAFDFFAQYANRFVAIATGEAQKGKQENAEKQAFKGNGATDAHLEVPLGPDMPQDLPTSKPVIKTLGADGHLMHGQEGEGAHGTGEGKNGKNGLASLMNELGLLTDDVPQEPKKPATNEGRLARLLAKTLDETKVPQGSAGDFMQAFKGMTLPQGMSREEVQKQAREFAEMLRAFGFEGMREQLTGKNGAQLAQEMLNARSLQELERMLEQKKMTAEHFPPRQSAPPEAQLPPEEYHPATLGKEPLRILKELGESRPDLDGRFERERLGQMDRAKVLPWAAEGGKVLVKAAERDPRDVKLPWLGEGATAFGRMGRKLGSNMLWNVLHRFREVGPDSAVEKEKFDQLAFGAVMLLVLLMGVTIALVSL